MMAYKSRTMLTVAGALTVLIAGTIFLVSAKEAQGAEIVVYKSPTCGCCSKWVDHLRDAGFAVTTHDTNDLTQIKMSNGIPQQLAACHTGIVDGYVVEGHVPADVIQRLLRERPDVVGIAVPGMPMGSPGMEGPYKEPYDVLTFDREGNTESYAKR